MYQSNFAELDFHSFREALAIAGKDWIERKQELQNLIETKPLVLFGFGGKGQMLARQIRDLTQRDITIFDTDCDKRNDAERQGFSVIEQLDQSGSRWAIILGACQSQLEQSRIVGSGYIYYQEAANLLGAPHLAHQSRDFETCATKNIEDLYQIYQLLHPESRRCFLQVLCFRLTGNPAHLRHARQPVSEMWLDKPSIHKKRLYRTFLDVGAFDGDTLRSFHHRFGCDRGIAVEANPSLFEAIKKVERLYPRGIRILPFAAWSCTTKIQFNEVREGMIQVVESSDGELTASPIDAYVDEPVDCLKMDIEGSEFFALEGCKNLLRKFKPDLAIAAYHQPDDLIALPSLVHKLGYESAQFEWHFSHYSDCLDDSIFYVIRKD